MIGIGILLMFVATALLLIFKSALVEFSMLLYAVGLFLMFKGEHKESQKIVIDVYGARKAYEKVTEEEIENYQIKQQAPLYKQKRAELTANYGVLSYFVSFSKTRNKWVAISNDWELKDAQNTDITAESSFGEDYAVVELFEKLSQLQASEACVKIQT
jgi:hypothetical protein